MMRGIARNFIGLVLVPVFALGSLTGATPADLKRSAWRTYHGDYNLSGIADTEIPDKLTRLWTFDAGGYVDWTPVAAEGRVFFATDEGDLFAISLETGKEIWNAALEKDWFSSPPVFADGLVIVGTRDGFLQAYDAAKGDIQWKYEVEGGIQGTANRTDLADGTKAVIVNAQADGAIHCVELTTGKSLWKTEAIDRCDGSASVADGAIVMGSCASALHVFSIEKKAKVADVELGGDAQVAGGVAIVDGIAYAGTRTGALCAVNVKTNNLIWTNEDSTGEAFSTPAVTDRLVVHGSTDGFLYALERSTGKTVWSFDSEFTASSPVVTGERIVFTSGGVLYILNLADGKKVWSAEVSDDATAPAVVAGRVVVGADDGTVSAWGPASAKPASKSTSKPKE